MTSEARCYKNTLSPVSISNPDDKNAVIQKLRDAIKSAISAIERLAPKPESDRHDNLYTGATGIALAYLRLSKQLGQDWEGFNFLDMMLNHMPSIHRHQPVAGRLSPIGSTTGPAVVELLQQMHSKKFDKDIAMKAITTLRHAVKEATEVDDDGGDEALYGRAGLLWALLNLRKEKAERNVAWIPDDILGDDLISYIVMAILEAGRRGKRKFGAEGLMWEWHGKAYLGAIHGAAGICTILLQCPAFVIDPIMSEILATTKMLCELAVNGNGHLPSSLPVRQRSYPYVQICHGSPGLILLLTALRRLRPSEWRTDSIFANTLEHASNAVWEQGLTKKGLGICHGVSGNAWVLLMTGEEKWVGKALALLMEAQEMPPLGDKKFNIPDAPWSLFEGVAGTVAAWSEAAAWLERGEEGLMGFPGLGGVGAVGVI